MNAKRRLALLAFVSTMLGVVPSLSQADPVSYVQGFELDNSGWFDSSYVVRVPSGSTSSDYANQISAASGRYFARLKLQPSTACSEGIPPYTEGPFTNLGCYGCTFPAEGYGVQVSVYLDVAYAAAHAAKRFDLSTAINGTDCNNRRDFGFRNITCGPGQPIPCGTTGLSGFGIDVGNGFPRCSATPLGPSNDPLYVTTSGWYTYEFQFNNVNGVLVVTYHLYGPDHSLLKTWTTSDPSDLIGSVVGGNRYLWFVNQEIPDLAIDSTIRTRGQVCGSYTCALQSETKKGAESCVASGFIPGPSPSSTPTPTLSVSCSNHRSMVADRVTLSSQGNYVQLHGEKDRLDAFLRIGLLDSDGFTINRSYLRTDFTNSVLHGVCRITAVVPESNASY